LTDVLGEDWQDEYYVWDCAAGTGNLLTGLTNKYNIWASTLDKQDVEVMKDRIRNGANLLEEHVFQFDFLNDDFTKLPKPLQDIINNPVKRKKLVVYINPPYAESNGKITKTRSRVQDTMVHKLYNSKLEKLSAELFAQFLIRIYYEIPYCIIAQFSTLKLLSGGNSKTFRNNFSANLKKVFIVQANTFDNVNGIFPIGFFIWDTSEKRIIEKANCNIFNELGIYQGKKIIYSFDKEKGKINDWLKIFRKKYDTQQIGFLMADSPDFQNNSFISILNEKGKRHGIFFPITKSTIFIASIYFAVRKIIEHTWINHNDQFLYPNDKWQQDTEFQKNCLIYTLFSSKNRITSNENTNHWIPFTESEVNSREKFDSNFMSKFINGKLKIEEKSDIYNGAKTKTTEKLEFSAEAKAVFDAGRKLWTYYHAQPNCNVNASLYDIREYFQGRNNNGKMNNKSGDEKYMKLINDLRDAIKILSQKIEPKVYEYEFLKE